MSENIIKGSYSSPWAPLHHRVFRMLWIASIVSNIGSWMHEVGAGWLMTSLAPSPLMVALVQAATSAPVFLLALPDRITNLDDAHCRNARRTDTFRNDYSTDPVDLYFRSRHRHRNDDAGMGRDYAGTGAAIRTPRCDRLEHNRDERIPIRRSGACRVDRCRNRARNGLYPECHFISCRHCSPETLATHANGK